MTHPEGNERAERVAGTPTALLVLGMHRSGTSALARVLDLLGVELGPGGETEGREHREIVRLHDELLEALGSSWDDPRPLPAERQLGDEARPYRDRLRRVVERDFAGRALWGLKDPRLCRLVPLWRSLLEGLGHSPRFVLLARPAAEVAASLRKRDAFAEAKSDLLWLEHLLAAERDTRGTRRAFLTYDGLLGDGCGSLARIARQLGLDRRAAIEATESGIETFLDPGLRHHRRPGTLRDPEHPWLRATYLAWEAAADGTDPGPALAAIRDRLDTAGRLLFAWTDVLRAERRPLGAPRGPRIERPAISLPPAGASAARAVSKDPTPGNAERLSS